MWKVMTVVSKSLIYKFLVDFIYPNKCPVCHKVIKWNKLICSECLDKIPKNSHKSTTGIENSSYEFSPFIYKGVTTNLIHSLKNDGTNFNFVEYSTKLIAQELKCSNYWGKIDIVTAIPMYKKKKSARGYNQAEVIAKYLADEIGKPVDFSFILHSSNTTEQHKLTARERKVHASKVYTVNPKHNDIKGKVVILCDDVITTGSSMDICSKILKEIGAKDVLCVSCALTTLTDE